MKIKPYFFVVKFYEIIDSMLPHWGVSGEPAGGGAPRPRASGRRSLPLEDGRTRLGARVDNDADGAALLNGNDESVLDGRGLPGRQGGRDRVGRALGKCLRYSPPLPGGEGSPPAARWLSANRNRTPGRAFLPMTTLSFDLMTTIDAIDRKSVV